MTAVRGVADVVQPNARPEHWAELGPQVPAVVDGNVALTYGQWNERADRLADALDRLTPGCGRAWVRSHQSLDWFVIRLALAKLGWEHAAISWRLTPHEVSGILAGSRPVWFFCDDEDPAELAGVCAASH